MSHEPPAPKNAVSPYPLGAAQAANRDGAKLDLAAKSAANLDHGTSGGAAPASDGRGLKIAAGAAIGSAAIAAALIFWNRSRD